MARIGIVSDSHDNLPAVEAALKELKKRGVECLVHAGDIIAPFTLRKFLDSGVEFYGVFGNNDGELLVLSKIARESGALLAHQPLMVEIEGLRAVVLHGAGGMEETEKLVTALAESGRFDVVIYGHTHEIDVRNVSGCIVVNPGEVCGYLSGKRTVVILETESKKVEIIEV